MKKINFKKIVAFVLLTPPILGVLNFTYKFLFSSTDEVLSLNTNFTIWHGTIDVFNDSTATSFSSPIPIYLGLMAVAGAYLLSHSDK
jgi:hypothetical protein